MCILTIQNVPFWGKDLQLQKKCCTFASQLKKGICIKEKKLYKSN